MKKHLKILLLIMVLFITGMILTACSDKKSSSVSSGDESSDNSTKSDYISSEEQVLITDDMLLLALPDAVRISDEAIQKINIKMKEAGINYVLYPVFIGGINEEFFDNLGRKEKELGRSIDISITGLFSDHLNSAYTVSNGYFEELNSYFEKNNGKNLYEKFTKEEWACTEIDGKYYSLPAVFYKTDSSYAIYKNLKYKNDRDKDENLLELLREYISSSAEQEGKKILIDNYYGPGIYCNGYSYLYFECFDTAEEKFKNVCKDDNIIETKNILNKLEEEGKIEYYDRNLQNYNPDDYFAIIGWDITGVDLSLFDIVFEEKKYMYHSNNMCMGIPSKSQNKEAAFDFLTLLYSDQEMIDMICYGIEGKDYVLENGLISDAANSMNAYFLGLTGFATALKTDGTKNRREEMFKQYDNMEKTYCGFLPKLEAGEIEVLMNAGSYMEQWLQDKNSQLPAEVDGLDKVIDKLNQQLDEYKKSK